MTRRCVRLTLGEQTTLLTVHMVSVHYGPIRALCEVSLEVYRGEVVAILGPNGAGKSTLLRAIMGLVRLSGGGIFYRGEAVHRLPPNRRVDLGIGYVPEGREVFSEMTVLDNLRMGSLSPRSRRHLGRNLETVYQLFPVLREREYQLAGTLSGGEQQMLAIGRALMTEPEILILDEPSLGLAPKVQAHIFSTIEELNARGVTILLVEQNVRRALAVCHRAYVLEAGELVVSGSRAELLSNPQVERAYLGIGV